MRTRTKALTMSDTMHSHRLLFAAFLAIADYVLMIAPAFAVACDSLNAVMYGVVDELTGNVGRGLATIGVFSIGVAAMLGKVTWGQAILVGVGIGGFFGAVGIANYLANAAGSVACA
jgi:type IV secretory pathway VirB2 component (pilin)